MKKRYSEEQIIGFLREAEGGIKVKDLCRRHGFSEASFYAWRSKFGGMDVSDAKRLKALEAENAKLKLQRPVESAANSLQPESGGIIMFINYLASYMVGKSRVYSIYLILFHYKDKYI